MSGGYHFDMGGIYVYMAIMAYNRGIMRIIGI